MNGARPLSLPLHSRRSFILAGAALLLARTGRAQSRAARVGVLSRESLDEAPVSGLRRGLRELGYAEGSNLSFEHVVLKEGYEKYPRYAAELVRARVEVIVTNGFATTQSAKNATSSIPIVMVIGLDPVRLGLVSNLARPEGNLTGFVEVSQELIGKRLELVKELIPGARDVAMLWNAGGEGEADSVAVAQAEAKRQGLRLRPFRWQHSAELAGVLEGIARAKVDALLPHASAILNERLEAVVRMATANRIPTVYGHKRLPQLGGLMSYAADRTDLFRRAARYVDRILKGAKPSELPIEQATKFELVINLKAAAALGLAVPRSLLLRADEVIQ